jgi:isoleucyl-tRNA synthetase
MLAHFSYFKYSILPIGSDIVGASYRPIFSSLKPYSGSLPILPSSHVTADSGTGLVHCAPAHGHEDYLVFRNLGLLKSTSSVLCHVDELGKFTGNVAEVLGQKGESIIGQEVLGNGNRAMVMLLKELGAIKKVQRMKHRYPYDWKTDKPVIIMYVYDPRALISSLMYSSQGNFAVVREPGHHQR